MVTEIRQLRAYSRDTERAKDADAVGQLVSAGDVVVWLDGYQLDRRGHAVACRRIFVRLAGLGRLRTP
ncbi:hypothetical protein [Actinoplanes sp. NPDC049599]|uniref:hypothetical protein n=1 Tax=Actinoplanes sp. NPDC049599 TaxID=3363903 RepID=UPI0037A46613